MAGGRLARTDFVGASDEDHLPGRLRGTLRAVRPESKPGELRLSSHPDRRALGAPRPPQTIEVTGVFQSRDPFGKLRAGRKGAGHWPRSIFPGPTRLGS